MKKALVFGGAFNPVTLAHIHLAEKVRRKLSFDYVIFIPSKSKYILSTEKKDSSFSEEERYKMLKEVSKTRDWMIVSDIEIKKEDQPRTYFTLKKLKEEGYDLKLLMGSDWLPCLEDKWLYIDEILDEFGIVILRRNHDDISSIINSSSFLKERKEKFIFIDVDEEHQEASSSKVRELLKKKDYKKVGKLVPQEILPYLKREAIL